MSFDDPRRSAHFDTLLIEALADPVCADYDALRSAYIYSDRYQPWYRDQEGLEELRMRMATGQWEDALTLGAELVEGDPLSVDLRFMLSRIFDHVNQEYEASLQRTFGNGLLRSVLRSGDGRTPETAVHVLDTRELSLVLASLHLRAQSSHLALVNDRWIDEVTCTGPSGERVMHFDIDAAQRWLIRLHG